MRQIRQILRAKGRLREGRVGKIYSAVRPELASSFPCMRNANAYRTVGRFHDLSADSAVIEPDSVTLLDGVKYRGRGAGDLLQRFLSARRACSLSNELELISGLQLQPLFSVWYRPRPQLRAAEVHKKSAFTLEGLFCSSNVLRHASPDFSVVARAVDSRTIHPGFDEIHRNAWVGGRLRR